MLTRFVVTVYVYCTFYFFFLFTSIFFFFPPQSLSFLFPFFCFVVVARTFLVLLKAKDRREQKSVWPTFPGFLGLRQPNQKKKTKKKNEQKDPSF